MVARREIPAEFQRWNAQWGAPLGAAWARYIPLTLRRSEPLRRFVGMFSFQNNNPCRSFEYPWAFYAASLQPGMQALEIGGALSGFQFVLSKVGLGIVNVDPGEDAQSWGGALSFLDLVLNRMGLKTPSAGRAGGTQRGGWPIPPDIVDYINSRFSTNVILKKTTLDKAGLGDDSFDRVFAISVIEHIPEGDRTTLMTHLNRVMKPDGILIATVDLFLDLQPFAEEKVNYWGTNVNIKDLIENNNFKLDFGEPSELVGFPEFDAAKIARRAKDGELLQNGSTIVQHFTCRKI